MPLASYCATGRPGRLLLVENAPEVIGSVIRIHDADNSSKCARTHYVFLRRRSHVPDSNIVTGAAAVRRESGVTTIVMPGATTAATAFLKASGATNLCHSVDGTC